MRSFLSLVLLGTLRAKKKEEVKRVIANNWISFEGAGCGGAILSSRAREEHAENNVAGVDCFRFEWAPFIPSNLPPWFPRSA